MIFKKMGVVMQYNELCQIFIGKGKIQPLQIMPSNGGYELLYQEGEKKSKVFCEDRTELEKILVEFGGKNPETCKAPSLFLKLKKTEVQRWENEAQSQNRPS
jgi:hypothetical protein